MVDYEHGAAEAYPLGEAPDRREQILRAAVRLFHAVGYRRASMAGIAREVGITPGAIYHHFRDKQAILDCAVEKGGAELLARTRALVGRYRHDRRRAVLLQALVEDLIAFVLDDVAMAAVARHDRVLASDEVRRIAEQAEDAVVAEWMHALARARRSPLPAGEARAMVHAALGAVYSVTHTEATLDDQALAAYLSAAVLAALRG